MLTDVPGTGEPFDCLQQRDATLQTCLFPDPESKLDADRTDQQIAAAAGIEFFDVPDGPLRISYAGCLSAHAVRNPAARATSKIVFTLRYACGYMGWQLVGSTGNWVGSINRAGVAVIDRMPSGRGSRTCSPPRSTATPPPQARAWTGRR
jgi:hypothetical protein